MRTTNNIFKPQINAKVFTLVLFWIVAKSWGQVNITTTSYTQNFGTANITSWTNNSTFPGWYMNIGAAANTGTFRGDTPNLFSSPNSYNAGGYWTYNCGSDAKIGSRASGSTPNQFLKYGVILRNTTGQAIQSLRVTYDGFQMSLAENNNNLNTIFFDYSFSAVVPLISAAGATSVAALNFVQVQNSSSGGSANQLTGYLCTQSRPNITACIPVTIPNNDYIMLRWNDPDNSANDHHMAIDNLRVDFGITAADCSIILPIQLIDFYATKKDGHNEVNWKVAEEINIDSYLIEKSSDGVNFSLLETTPLDQGKIYGQSIKSYSVIDENPFNEITYYRLATKSNDGSIEYYNIISVDEKSTDWNVNHYQLSENLIIEFKNTVPKNSTVSLFDLSGKLLIDDTVKDSQTKISTQNFSEGIYFLRVSTPYKTQNFKIVIQK